jgi:hypothetical protein
VEQAVAQARPDTLPGEREKNGKTPGILAAQVREARG